MSENKILREIGLNCTVLVGLTETLNNELSSFLPTQTDNIILNQESSVGSNNNEFNNLVDAIAVLKEVEYLALHIAQVVM